MKKIMSLMLGLALVTGTVAFAQKTDDTTKTTKKKSGKKGKKGASTTTDKMSSSK